MHITFIFLIVNLLYRCLGYSFCSLIPEILLLIKMQCFERFMRLCMVMVVTVLRKGSNDGSDGSYGGT